MIKIKYWQDRDWWDGKITWWKLTLKSIPLWDERLGGYNGDKNIKRELVVMGGVKEDLFSLLNIISNRGLNCSYCWQK